MERHPSHPSLWAGQPVRTGRPGYGDTWRREACRAPAATLAFRRHGHAASFADDLPLLPCPDPSQPTCCLGSQGASNGAERCPQQAEPCAGDMAELAAPWGESQGWGRPGVVAVLPAGWRVTSGEVGSALSPGTAMREPAWGPQGWSQHPGAPHVFVTTSSSELCVCRQTCPAHVSLRVVAGTVMPMG